MKAPRGSTQPIDGKRCIDLDNYRSKAFTIVDGRLQLTSTRPFRIYFTPLCWFRRGRRWFTPGYFHRPCQIDSMTSTGSRQRARFNTRARLPFLFPLVRSKFPSCTTISNLTNGTSIYFVSRCVIHLSEADDPSTYFPPD